MQQQLGLPYRIIVVNIGRGDEFRPEFLAISPNNQIPAIVDHTPLAAVNPCPPSSPAPFSYLAKKTGRFCPTALRGGYEVAQWVF
ncbi:MAG: hypothetical protein RMJ98_09505 [Myxococcales bacterium]|nr:hypothetical protein [Polyangiaceae bacterium]MDW8249523.1 hypothetical protein [Myxococcales bacterium]